MPGCIRSQAPCTVKFPAPRAQLPYPNGLPVRASVYAGLLPERMEARDTTQCANCTYARRNTVAPGRAANSSICGVSTQLALYVVPNSALQCTANRRAVDIQHWGTAAFTREVAREQWPRGKGTGTACHKPRVFLGVSYRRSSTAIIRMFGVDAQLCLRTAVGRAPCSF